MTGSPNRIASKLSGFVQANLTKEQKEQQRQEVNRVAKRDVVGLRSQDSSVFQYPEDQAIYLSKELAEEDYAQDIISKLRTLAEKSTNPIYLIINCNGGAKTLCLAICDTIRLLSVPVYTVVLGRALSSGALIFLAGEKRYITKFSAVMFHYIRIQGGGLEHMSLGEPELADYLTAIKKGNKLVERFIIERTGIKRKKLKEWMAIEKLFNAEDAVKWGIAHEVI